MEILQVADAVAREKGIEQEVVLAAMEEAIQKAGRSKYGHEHDIRAVVDRIHSELAEPIRLTGRASGEQQVVQVTASIGTAFTTDPRADPELLVAEADGTMYATKRARSESDPPAVGVASAPDRRAGAGPVMSPPPPT